MNQLNQFAFYSESWGQKPRNSGKGRKVPPTKQSNLVSPFQTFKLSTYNFKPSSRQKKDPDHSTNQQYGDDNAASRIRASSNRWPATSSPLHGIRPVPTTDNPRDCRVPGREIRIDLQRTQRQQCRSTAVNIVSVLQAVTRNQRHPT